MKIKTVIIKNFRGYKSETHIDLDDNLCAIVGKNDVGKSTIFDALDIFFNDGKGIVKIEDEDISRSKPTQTNNKGILDNRNELDSFYIGVQFSDLPNEIIVDVTSKTSLKDELLLDSSNYLTIIKKFTKKTLKGTMLLAKHPFIDNQALILYKNADLKKLVSSHQIDSGSINLTNNTELRKLLRDIIDESFTLTEDLIEIDSTSTKDVWESIKKFIPQYYLFRSDRKNSDQDGEVKDPLNIVVKEVFSREEIITKLEEIDNLVREQVTKLGDRTIEELHKIDSSLADSLTPSIPEVPSLKWADVYKSVSICGDQEIPINKRGSGVRRLILLGFLLAQINENKINNSSSSGIIYAIEEPETSLHFDQQKLLINALSNRAKSNAQVLVTTHSSTILKELDYSQIRMVIKENLTEPRIVNAGKQSLRYKSLNEIAYIALGEATEEYHNELFGYVFEISKPPQNTRKNYTLNDFDKWLTEKGCEKNKTWYKEQSDSGLKPQECTLHYYIRNYIHHPENKHNTKYTSEELENSIKELRDIASRELPSSLNKDYVGEVGI